MNTSTYTHTQQSSQNVMGFSGPPTQKNIHRREDNGDLVNFPEISKGIGRLSCPRDLSFCPSDSNLYDCGVKTLHRVPFETLFR